MKKKRILFLGVTGVDKKRALANIHNSYDRDDRSFWREPVDFEADFLFNPNNGGSIRKDFLDTDFGSQVTTWLAAWDRFKKTKLSKIPTEAGLMLGIHASYLRGHYGVRTVLLPHIIAKDFRPDLIITLIADVYDMWWRTEERAKGDALLGRPTLEDLLFGRRNELIVGDLIAGACRPERPTIRNLMLSAYHPIETVRHCIDSDSPRIVYLSFPISEPRRMAEGKPSEGIPPDPSGIAEVSQFVARAYELQKARPNLVFQCPLTIDELPLRKLVLRPDLLARYKLSEEEVDRRGLPSKDDDDNPIPYVDFPRDELRWKLSDLCDTNRCIAAPHDGPQKAFPIPQIEQAMGNMYTDVTLRDYRYVEQAECLAVFNPMFNTRRDKISGSVQGEIEHALGQGKRVFVYQDPDRDRPGAVDLQFGKQQATMKAAPTQNRKSRASTPEELLDVIAAYQAD